MKSKTSVVQAILKQFVIKVQNEVVSITSGDICKNLTRSLSILFFFTSDNAVAKN